MRRFSVREIVEVCESKAVEYRTKAVLEQRDRDREKMIKADAMGFAALEIAETFQKIAGQSPTGSATSEKIEQHAREIDPAAFAKFQGMITRLRGQGHDDGHAIQTALSVYGEALEAARQKARDAASADDGDQDSSEYDRGINDAIHWHEIRAREADLQEARETLPGRKIKYRQRADRHRLYARKMRQDLAEMVAQREQASRAQTQQAARQTILPLHEGHVPVEVQQAHLRKNEVLDAD